MLKIKTMLCKMTAVCNAQDFIIPQLPDKTDLDLGCM